AASHEELQLMPLEGEVLSAIHRMRGLGLDDRAYARVWSECMIEVPHGLVVRKEGGPFSRAVLALDTAVQNIGSGVSPTRAAEWMQKQLPTVLGWLDNEPDREMLRAWTESRIAAIAKW